MQPGLQATLCRPLRLQIRPAGPACECSAVIDIGCFLSVEGTGRPQPGCRPAGVSETRRRNHANLHLWRDAAAHIGEFRIKSQRAFVGSFSRPLCRLACENPLRLEHAGLDCADRHQPAARRGAGFVGLQRRVAAAQDDGIAEPQLGSGIVGNATCGRQSSAAPVSTRRRRSRQTAPCSERRALVPRPAPLPRASARLPRARRAAQGLPA